MLMILARLVRSESFWAVAKVRSPHTGPGIRYIIRKFLLMSVTCLWSALPTATNVGGPTRCAPSTIVLSGPSPTCE